MLTNRMLLFLLIPVMLNPMAECRYTEESENRSMSLKLARPTLEYAEQVMQYRQEMLDNNDSFDGCAGLASTCSAFVFA